MDNEKLRLMSMIQMAREHMQFGRFKEADQLMQNILHGDILPDKELNRASELVRFERGFKALSLETATRAVWIAGEHSGIIGEINITIGGDEFLIEQFGPVLRQLTGG